MTFVSSLEHECFPVERQTSAGRLVPRVVVLFPDGTLVVCKSSGAITRLVHVNTITHLNYATTHGIQGCLVHLRFERDHDLLFSHVMDDSNEQQIPLEEASPPKQHQYAGRKPVYKNIPVTQSRLGPDSLVLPFEVASVLKARCANFIRRLLEIRNNSPTAEPLEATHRHSGEVVRDKAELAKAPSFVPPQACHPSTSDTVYIPTMFRPLNIKTSAILTSGGFTGAYHRTCQVPTPSFVDTSFLTMLKFAVDTHPNCSMDPPLAAIDAPAPHKGTMEVSDRFLAAFTEAYVTELPLCINVHTGTTRPRSFRASEEFWAFIQRRAQIQRPTNEVFMTIASNHIEVYVVGREHQIVALPVHHWNSLISRWEMVVRRGSKEGDELERMGAPPASNQGHLDKEEDGQSLVDQHRKNNTDSYWEAFVNEIERFERLGM